MSKTLINFIKVTDGAYSAHGGMFTAQRFVARDRDGYPVTKYEVIVNIGRERIVLFDPFGVDTHSVCPGSIAEADALITDYMDEMAAAVNVRRARAIRYATKQAEAVAA